MVDRTFDLAEQTLAAQHQLARTLAGVATRQVDTTVETVDTTVAAVQTTVGEPIRRVAGLVQAAQAGQERTPDRRTYEEGTLEQLRERAGELQLEGRSAMSKDELIAALRQHAK
jgi:hypothetical protein